MKEKINFFKKHYLINGGKALWGYMHTDKFQVGFRLLLISLGLVLWNIIPVVIAFFLPFMSRKADYSLGIVKNPKAPKKKGMRMLIDTKGATGDNLKLLKDLGKRVKLVGASPKSKIKPEIIESAVRSALEKVGMKEKEIKAFQELTDPGDKGIRARMKKIGAELVELQNKIKEQIPGLRDDSVRGQVARWHKKNAELIKRVKGGEEGVALPPLKIRSYRAANSPMTPANTLTSTTTAYNSVITSFEIESGLTEPLRREPTLWDSLIKGVTSAFTYFWIKKYVPGGSGVADFIAPGVLKPGISFELKAEASVAKKIAVSDKVATELLDDVDGMASYITDELAYQLKDHLNAEAATGVSSSTDINGMRTLSVAFTASGLATQNPNYFDCLIAVGAQMKSGYLKAPITFFVNPIDKANMIMSKAVNQGQYLLIEGKVVGQILEDTNVPVGYFQAAMLQFYYIKIYKGFTIAWGYENQDFTKNLRTVIAEMRIHQYFKTEYTGALVYDTFANVQAAIAI